MSSVTKTGSSAFFASWQIAAITTAIHYVSAVATIAWFLSMTPTDGPVESFKGINSGLPTSIDIALTNIHVVEDAVEHVFKQGVQRVINAFTRTTSGCSDGELNAQENRRLESTLSKAVNEAEGLAKRNESIVKQSEIKAERVQEQLEAAIEAERALASAGSSTPSEKAQLTRAQSKVADLTRARQEAIAQLDRDQAALSDAQHDIERIARNSSFIVRSCKERQNAEEELAEQQALREQELKMPQSKKAPQKGGRVSQSRRAPGAARGVKGSVRAAKAAAATEAEGAVGNVLQGAVGSADPMAKAEVEETVQLAEEATQGIAAIESIVGCNTPYRAKTLTTLQNVLDRGANWLVKTFKPTTMLDMDRRQLAGEFAGVGFYAAPVRAPPNQTLAAIALAPLRPIIYMVLALIFAGYLAYTMVGIPFAMLMNGIRNSEWFSDNGEEMPRWQSILQNIALVVIQLIVAGWSMLGVIPMGGIIFWLTAIFALTPLAFIAVDWAGKTQPSRQVLKYAAISALPMSMLILAFSGVGLLNSKLPKHSTVKSAAGYAWWAWFVATTGLGIGAMMREGGGERSSGWSIAAWVALALLVALPPVAVLAEGL